MPIRESELSLRGQPYTTAKPIANLMAQIPKIDQSMDSTNCIPATNLVFIRCPRSAPQQHRAQLLEDPQHAEPRALATVSRTKEELLRLGGE